MVNFAVTRRLTFCAGHRVYQHESKCRNPHGHNYVVHVTATAAKWLDSVGRVIDFSVLKDKLGTWLDDNWDHAFIWFKDDPDMKEIYEKNYSWKNYRLPNNPTAENMGEYLLREVCPELFKGCGVLITKIVIEETENCVAEVTL